MLRNFFVIAGRKIMRSKLFASLNVLGLSLGIVSFIMINLYVRHEKSFDDFRSPQLYRVAQYAYENNVEAGKSAQWVPALAPALKQDIPEIADAARLAHTGPFMADPVMQVDQKIFRESSIYYADSSFLELFSYEMVAGSSATALALPDQVALSESAAKRYFGNEDPLACVGVVGGKSVGSPTHVLHDLNTLYFSHRTCLLLVRSCSSLRTYQQRRET